MVKLCGDFRDLQGIAAYCTMHPRNFISWKLILFNKVEDWTSSRTSQ